MSGEGARSGVKRRRPHARGLLVNPPRPRKLYSIGVYSFYFLFFPCAPMLALCVYSCGVRVEAGVGGSLGPFRAFGVSGSVEALSYLKARETL